MLCGELLKQAERYTERGARRASARARAGEAHGVCVRARARAAAGLAFVLAPPRRRACTRALISEGYARDHVIEMLESWKVPVTPGEDGALNRELLESVARTSLRTKLQVELADMLVDAVVQAVMTVRKPDEPIDLHMVEILAMRHKSAFDSRFVNGLILDHGSRHPDMPTNLTNCHILTCNVSLEYEKSEVASGFYYSSAEEREKMIESERKFTDDKCKQLIEFKRSVCKEGESFVVINQKGIDPLSLDMLAKEGIYAARRAKRRNMERLTLACGGVPVNSFDDIDASCLGHAGRLSEMSLGDDKFCFIEDVKNPLSCTIMVKGANQHIIEQIKDALRDGLRAVKNTVDDAAVIAGGGAFEVAAAASCVKFKDTVAGKAKLGVQAYADALLVIPKLLAENSGFDVQDSLIKMQNEHAKSGGKLVGLDVHTGDAMLPDVQGIWDNWIVKRQMLYLSTVLATQLLLVDEVMKAGKRMGGGGGPGGEDEGGD